MSPYGNFNVAAQEQEKNAINAPYELRKEMGDRYRENIKLTIKLFDTACIPESEIWGIDCKESRKTGAQQILKMATGCNYRL